MTPSAAAVLERMAVVRGDITAETTDAVVNAANTDLLLGAGVAGAIRARGGDGIQRECDARSPVELGGAALTSGGTLPARHVIHAAAMRLGGSPSAESIRQATLNTLRIAAQERFEKVSFPALGTGVGGFPARDAARIMLHEAFNFLASHQYPQQVRFILFDEETRAVFAWELEAMKREGEERALDG